MKGEAPLSTLTGVPGWESPEEQKLLKKYANRVPIDGITLEIGSEFGMSASIFRKCAFPSVHIVCVDINPKAPFMANLKEADLNWRIHPFYHSSKEFFELWPEIVIPGFSSEKSPKFDLIFIDGDHTYDGVLFDLEGCDPLLKDGGIMLLHDTACSTNRKPHPLHYEVSRAVAKWWDTERYQLVETVDSIMVLQKKAPNA